MKRLSGGIDVGSESHHITILDEEDHILYNQKVSHKLNEFTENIKLFKQIEKQERGKLSFALEGKNGYSAPFDRILLDKGFTLYNVDNLKLKRFREAFSGEWRDDERDSLMLSKMLKLKKHINSEREKVFIKIERPSLITESLKLLSRHQQTLIDERVRLTNRLGKKLLEVCPQILKLGKLKNKKTIAILAKYPDFSKYKKITLKSLLKIKGIGKKGAPFLLKRLNNIRYMPGLTDIYKTIILSYAQRILQLREEIEDIDKSLDKIGEKNKEVNHLKTIPGVATKLASRLTGEIGNINRFPSEKQLAIYCGIACVNNDSGKVTKAKAAYKTNKICKQTLITMAGCSIRLNFQCSTYYLKKRAEGKSHNHTLRCLSRQLIKVIYKMLTEDRDYIVRKELKKVA
ncbi:MAG: IS110 family transposase [Candidatus Caldatribacteriota bacterium]|nr:IS110 family transposase [Candidatus Caldatribacteriota bacterium]